MDLNAGQKNVACVLAKARGYLHPHEEPFKAFPLPAIGFFTFLIILLPP
jgi:hypothetical protein